MKIVFRLMIKFGFIIIVFFISYFSYYLYFSTRSESIATEMVQKYCKAQGSDFNKLTGPKFSHSLGTPEFNCLGIDIHPAVCSWNYSGGYSVGDVALNNDVALAVLFDEFYRPHLIVRDLNHHPF